MIETPARAVSGMDTDLGVLGGSSLLVQLVQDELGPDSLGQQQQSLATRALELGVGHLLHNAIEGQKGLLLAQRG